MQPPLPLRSVDDSAAVVDALQDWLAEHAPPRTEPRLCISLSGGLDSCVLLHALVNLAPAHFQALRAVHVDHGLQAQSSAWAEACRSICAGLDVPLQQVDLALTPVPGASIEAEARTARYAALAARLDAGEWLLTAHHQDDQLETVLLQLIRGAGIAGLAAMPTCSPLGPGWQGRPLLGLTRSQLAAYAQKFSLQWVEDPSNSGERFDRSWLRQEVLPALRARWPALSSTVARSARHCAEASQLLQVLAAADAEGRVSEGRLSVGGLSQLDAPRQANLLRAWIDGLALSMPSTARLASILRDVVNAREDAMPVVRWAGAEVRRYRDYLYAMAPLGQLPEVATELEMKAGASIELAAGLGRLELVSRAGLGLRPLAAGTCLSVRFGTPGAKLRPAANRPSKALRNLYQEAGIVPWRRPQLPQLWLGTRLAAVADLWIESELSVEPGEQGLVPVWHGRPQLN